MKGLAILLVLAFVILVTLAAYYYVAGVIEKKRAKKARWKLTIHEAPDSTEFWLTKGPNADFVGRARRSALDYSEKFSDLEAKAEDMVHDRNAAIHVLQQRNK